MNNKGIFILLLLLAIIVAIDSISFVDFIEKFTDILLIVIVGVIMCLPVVLIILGLVATGTIKAALALSKRILGSAGKDIFSALGQRIFKK